MSSLSQPQPQPKHLQRKLPDVITAVSENETKSSEDIVNHIGEKAKGEEAVKKSEAVREETENKSEVFLCKSDIKGERSPVITPTTTVPAPQYAINKKQSGGVNHETQGTQSQILRQSSTLNLSLSEVNPAERRTVIVNDVVSNGDRNHNQPCNMNVILNTIALNGLDKVRLDQKVKLSILSYFLLHYLPFYI